MAPGVVSAGAEASQYATTNVPTASPGETVDQVRGAMLGTAYESAAELVLNHSQRVPTRRRRAALGRDTSPVLPAQRLIS